MLKLFTNYLDPNLQHKVIGLVMNIIKEAPLITPVMQNGTKFNISITNCGDWGWISDKDGYRYVDRHPVTKNKWPELPKLIKDLAYHSALEAGFPKFEPDSCLINHYKATGKLGLHKDKDELDFGQPIVSISLGDSAIFQYKVDNNLIDQKLNSGDILVIGNEHRLVEHGIKKIIDRTSSLVPGGGRINLTLRRAK